MGDGRSTTSPVVDGVQGTSLQGTGLMVVNQELALLHDQLRNATTSRDQCLLFNQLAILQLRTNIPEALRCAEEACSLAQRILVENPDDGVLLAQSLLTLGSSYRSAGDFEHSHEYFNEAESLFRTLGDEDAALQTMDPRVMSYLDQGLFHDARKVAERAIAALLEIERRVREGIEPRYKTRTASYRVVGKYLPDARAEALHFDYLALWYNFLAQAEEAMGHYAMAVGHYWNSLDRWRSRSQKVGELTSTLHNLGGLYVTLEDYDRARHCFEEALRLDEEHGDELGVARNISALAEVSRQTGDLQTALSGFQESIARVRRLGSPVDELSDCYAIAECYRVLEMSAESMTVGSPGTELEFAL